MSRSAPTLERAFREHQRVLWDVCLRMTGSAADADDLVQETFVRAAEHPPPSLDAPLRPWLVRVAVNLSRDFLRARRRRSYVGPWLPSPVETGERSADAPDDRLGPEARYGLLESSSLAFLLALELLTPQQRAVLVLRDVFDFSVAETAQALRLTHGAVKATHLRARKVMEAYDETRAPPTLAVQTRTRAALEQLMAAVLTHDAAAMESLLAKDVRAFSDGGGVYYAALNPILGPDKVARFFWGLNAKLGGAAAQVDFRMFSGLPGLWVEIPDLPEGQAPRFTLHCQLGPDDRIRQIHVVLAPAKLRAVQPMPA